MTQLDLNRVRQSIKNQIGSKIKISANRGRHKFVTEFFDIVQFSRSCAPQPFG